MTRNDDFKASTNPLGAAIAGAVVGATAVYLADKDNRRRVKHRLNRLRQAGTEKLDEVEKKIKEAGKDARQKASDAADKAADALEEAEKKVRRTARQKRRA